MSDGLDVNISGAWMYLKKVRFHKLDDERWDRKGTIATLFFEKFPNSRYHQGLMTFCVRAITSLINPSHSLMDLEEYPHAEMNHCWVYYGLCLNEEREECQENMWIPVRVDHKYWSPNETQAFRKIIHALAHLNGAEIDDCLHPLHE